MAARGSPDQPLNTVIGDPVAALENVRRLLEFRDNGGAERRKVRRRSAGDQLSIDDDFANVDDSGTAGANDTRR